MRTFLLALALLAACKTDDQAKAPPPAAPAPRTAPPVTAPPPPPPAQEPAAPPPTRSRQALEKRAEVFGQLAEAAKRDHGDCARLGEDLAKLTDELRTASQLRADIAPADAAEDLVVVTTVAKAVRQTSSSCQDTSKIDAVLDIIAEVPK